jgi:hypothetical protein
VCLEPALLFAVFAGAADLAGLPGPTGDHASESLPVLWETQVQVGEPTRGRDEVVSEQPGPELAILARQ